MKKTKNKIRSKAKKKVKDKKAEKKSKLIALAASLLVLGLFGLGISTGSLSGGLESITGIVGVKTSDLSSSPTITKIIPLKREATGALFDIIVKIPEAYQEVKSGEELLISVELFNFGGPGKTDVSIAYIITNSEGDVILIEHEERVVETQDSFLKEITLPETRYGDHKLFVEMLYSNTSAVATGEFHVPLH